MKKSYSTFCKALAAAFLLSAPMAFTSCGDDDDPVSKPATDSSTPSTTHPASVKFVYDATLEQPWFDYFDVIRTLVDENGTKVDTMEASIGYTREYDWISAPKAIKLCIVAKPKKNVHELLDSTEIYRFDYSFSASATGYSETGVEMPFSIPTSGMQYNSADELFVRGSDFDKLADAVDTLFNVEYDIK